MISRFRSSIVVMLGVCALMAAHALPCNSGPAISHKKDNVVRKKLVVIVANRLLLSDLNNPKLPTISKMLQNGAVGLISPNCLGVKSESAVLLTAGAGTSCRGGLFVREFYDANEVVDGTLAGDVYTARTGYKANKNSAVFLGLGPALRANAEPTNRPIMLGACGEAVRKFGKKTCAVGNSDLLPERIDRSTALLAMDSRGLIDIGKLTGSPWDNLSGCLNLADYIVVNYGDTVRLDESKLSMSDKAYELHKTSILYSLDDLLSSLINSPQAENFRFMLVSFSPPSDSPWIQLTPMVVYPSATSGLLTSSTTRAHGLIAASDYAPSVLKYLGVPAVNEMIGCAISEGPAKGKLDALQDMVERVEVGEKLIAPVSWFFALLGIVSFSGAAISIAFGLRISRRVMNLLKTCLVALVCAPLSMLLAVLAPTGIVAHITGILISLAVLTLLSIILSVIISRKSTSRALPIIIAACITSIVIVIDLITGSRLTGLAVLSSSQITAMRFYGIGNEYAGVFISMVAVICLFINARQNAVTKWIAILLGVMTIILLDVGKLGANYGATIAAAVTFGLVCMAIWRGGFGIRHVAGFLLIGVALVVLSGYVDFKISGEAGSHVARATGIVEKMGGGYLFSMAARKVAHNVWQSTSYHAVRAIFGFIPFLVLWFWFVQKHVKQMLGKEKHIIAGLKGILIGSIFAYLLNDSGIVIAGIMIAMIVLILLYSLLEKPAVWMKSTDSSKEA